MCANLISTRNSSGDEIANVDFLYDDGHTRTTKYNRLLHKFRHMQIDDMLCVGCRFTGKFSEITQCNGHYDVQGHSRSPILVPIESSYDLVITGRAY